MLASFDLLARYSSFFATLKDLPRPDEQEETVIPLPLATSTGLALVISVLEDYDTAVEAKSKAATTGEGTTTIDVGTDDMAPNWTTVSEADLGHIAAAMDVADAYDMPVFTTHYVSKVHQAIAKDPALAFTMASLAKDEIKARQSAGDMLARGCELTGGMKALLEQYSPEYLAAHEAHRQAYTNRRLTLLYDLKHQTPMTNGFNDYGQMCKRHHHGCSTHNKYASWKKMRIAYAIQEYETIGRIAMTNNHSYHVNVGCQKCSTRVSRCFRRALGEFAEVKGAFAL